MNPPRFVPRIKVFFCSWWSRESARRAGLDRFADRADLDVSRVGCTSHLQAASILQAFRHGADGVWISGCQPGDCPDGQAHSYARRQYYILKNLLVYVGLEPQRLLVSWISARDFDLLSETAARLVEGVHQVGPVSWRPHLAERGA